MAMLVQEVMDFEAEAESILSEARAEGERLEESVGREIAAYRESLEKALHERLAAFGLETEEKYQALTHDAAREKEKALEDVKNISPEAISNQVELIVARFQGL